MPSPIRSESRTPAVEALVRLPVPDRRDALESLVAAEFKQALLMSDQDELRPVDNYFALGLTSLRATEVKQRLEAGLGCELDTSVLFASSTVRQVADHIAEVALPEFFPGQGAAVATGRGTGHRPLVDELIKDLYEG